MNRTNAIPGHLTRLAPTIVLAGAILFSGCDGASGPNDTGESANQVTESASGPEASSDDRRVDARPAAPSSPPPQSDNPRMARTPQELRLPSETLRLINEIMTDNAVAVHAYLERGGDANLRGHRDETILHIAARNGGVEIVHLLLQHGADVMSRDVAGVTPLHLAARYGHVDVCKVLVAGGADINARAGRDQNITPLTLAAARSQHDVVEYLGSLGAHP